MLTIPSQDALRTLLDSSFVPHEHEQFLEHERRHLSATSLTCEFCGLSGTQDQLNRTRERINKLIDEEKHGAATPFGRREYKENYSPFTIAARDGNPMNLAAANWGVACEVCAHVANALNPHYPVKGTYGLFSAVPQSEISAMWRALRVMIASEAPGASTCRDITRHIASETRKSLLTAMGEPITRSIRLTSRDVCYWLAYTKPEHFEVWSEYVPDLRFIPSTDFFHFAEYPLFCLEVEKDRGAPNVG